MSAASRQRRRRERERAGRTCLRVEVDHYAVVSAAIKSGLLSDEEALDVRKVEQAAAAILHVWAQGFLGE